MACTYKYNGKNYTRAEVIELIRNNQLSLPFNSSSARQWLKDTLGMQDEEILTNVSSLVVQGVDGRFMQDGKILLSEIAEEGTEYHEAFHRVFQMLLTDKERKNIIEAFKKQKNWKEKLKPIQELYKNNSVDGLIEEYLAEEFRDYVLNNRKMATEHKSWFDKIIDFFKKFFATDKDILFQNIVEGKFKTKPILQYPTTFSNRLRVGNTDISQQHLNEILESFTYHFFNIVFNSKESGKNIYNLLDGDTALFSSAIEATLLNKHSPFLKEMELSTTLRREVIIPVIKDLWKRDENNKFIFSDKANTKLIVNGNSAIYAKIKEYIKDYGLTIKMEEVVQEDGKDATDIQEDDNIEYKDNVFNKSTVELDQISSMSKAIKFMLSSVKNTKKKTDLGLSSVYGQDEVIRQVSTTLAGLPADFEIMKQRLLDDSSKYPHFREIVDRLSLRDSTNPTDSEVKLLIDFEKFAAKHFYELYLLNLSKDAIFVQSANLDTAVNKVYGELVSNLNNKAKDEVIEQWKKAVAIKPKTVEEKIIHLKEMLKAIGFTDNAINNVVVDNAFMSEEIFKIWETLKTSLNVASVKLDNLDRPSDLIAETRDKNSDIGARIKKDIIPLWAEFERGIELQGFTAKNTPQHSINLNSFQTLVINKLNYAASKKTALERVKAIEELLPEKRHLFFLNEDNKWQGKTSWANDIVKGKKIKLALFNGVIAQTKDNQDYSDLNETDYYMTQFNATLQGYYTAMKHSDRSTFYLYKPESKFYFDNVNATGLLVEHLWKYWKLENEMIEPVKSNPEYYNKVANYGKNRLKGRVIFQGIETKEQMLEWIDKSVAEVEKDMLKYKVINPKENTHPLFINKDMWNENKDMKYHIRKFAVNAMINHLEEIFMFGDLALYKSPTDMWKRFNVDSSTGDVASISKLTENYLKQKDAITKVVIDGIEMTYDNTVKLHPSLKDKSGIITEFVLEEEKDKFNDEVIDEYTEILKQNFENVIKPHLKAIGRSDAQIAKQEKNLKLYIEKYKEVNKEDGQSYLNMFFYRNYLNRFALWSDGLENNFQIELEILAQNTKDVKVFFHPKDKKFLSQANFQSQVDNKDEWVLVNPWDITEVNSTLTALGYKDIEPELYFSKLIKPFAPLKPQYTGAFYLNEQNPDSADFKAVRKTSYKVLMPSQYINTDGRNIIVRMIKDGADIAHFGSAAKVGAPDIKAIAKSELSNKDKNYTDKQRSTLELLAKNGMRAYEDASFADTLSDLFDSYDVNPFISILDWRYMKDQNRIEAKDKKSVRNATQPLKLNASNLFTNSIPLDYTNGNSLEELKANWEAEPNKAEVSKIYRDYAVYQDNVDAFIEDARKKLQELLREGGVLNYEKLSQTVIQQARDRNSPKNIIDGITQLFKDNGTFIEELPNYKKIENILYSLVSNNGIILKRPGDAKAQVSNTFRQSKVYKNKDESVSSKDGSLRPYGLYKDGSLRPAEIATAIPDKWISTIMDYYQTSNLLTAITKLNKEIEILVMKDKSEFTPKQLALYNAILLKGVRIPNQQLSSNDALIVREFLLPNEKASVFVNAEHVVKTGSDFDIDKLFTYIKEIAVGNLGITSVTEEMLSDEYLERLLNEKDNLKDQINNFKSANKELFSSSKEEEFAFLNRKGLDYTSLNQASKDLRRQLKSYFTELKEINDYLGNVYEKTEEDAKEKGKYKKDFKSKRARQLELNQMIKDIRGLSQEVDTFEIQLNNQYEIIGQNKAEWQRLKEQLNSVYSQLKSLGNQNYLANKLLDSELEILLSSYNKHVLLAPVIDDVLKSLKPLTEDASSYKDALSVAKNVFNTLLFISSKGGVGQVVPNITIQAIIQNAGIEMNEYYESLPWWNPNEDKITYTSRLPIDSDNSLTNIYDSEGNFISEVFSAIATSQVDGVKDPYAWLLNINRQTLNFITYLTLRGVPIKETIGLLQSNLVSSYLLEARNNESLTNSELREEKNKIDLLVEVLGIKKADVETLAKKSHDEIVRGTFEVKDDKSKLMFFLYVVEQTKHFNAWRTYMSPDTKTLKDSTEFDELVKLRTSLQPNPKTGMPRSLIKNNPDDKSMVSEFMKTREYYKEFDVLSFLRGYNDELFRRVQGLSDRFEEIYKKKDKLQKATNTMNLALLNYVVQNFSTDFINVNPESLFTGDNSIPKQILAIKNDVTNPLSKNALINEFHPLIGNFNKDYNDTKQYDSLRLFSRILRPFTANQLIDSMTEIEEANPQLYKDLVKYFFLQTGLANSPYNYEKILPVVYRSELFRDAAQKFVQQDLKEEMQSFWDVFTRSTNQAIPKWNKKMSEYYPSFKYAWKMTEKKVKGRVRMVKVIVDIDGKEVPTTGSTFFQWFKTDKKPTITNQPVQEQKEDTMTKDKVINIYAGTNENAELSNFAYRPFESGGFSYKNVEQAFQHAKWTTFGIPFGVRSANYMGNANESDSIKDKIIIQIEKILNSKTGAEAKKLGGDKTIIPQKYSKELLDNWDNKSSRIMKELLLESFEQNPDALKKLLTTGNATLTHTQDKGKWGKEFPKLLMEVREELSKPNIEEDNCKTNF